MMDRKNRLCIFCEHLDFEENEMWGTTMTGQYGWKGWSCKKFHFDSEDVGTCGEVEERVSLFKRAVDCPDYFQPLDLDS